MLLALHHAKTSDFCTVNALTAKSRADGNRGEGWRANSVSLFLIVYCVF